MKSLSQLQQSFKRSVLGQDNDLLEMIKDTNPEFSIEDRVDVYSYGIRIRLEDSLVEDFPLLVKAMGEQAFRTLTNQYMAAYTSRTYNLSEVSLSLAKYLKENPLTEHPYAGSLAEFEIEKLLSDSSELNQECHAIENIGSEDLNQVRLIFDSSVRLFECGWSLIDKKIVEQAFYVVIYEYDYIVTQMLLTREMFLTVKNLCEGQSLPQAAAHLEDDQGPEVSNLFSELVRLKILIGFERKQ